MAKIVRESIDFYQAHMERVKRMQEKKQKALNAVGMFSSSNAK